VRDIRQQQTDANIRQTGRDVDSRLDKEDGLSIRDPNNPANNISGGSSKAKYVFQLFSDAYDSLQDKLSTFDLSGTSILEAIIGGNYESYRIHRDHIRQIH
jgi:non-canonical poly(A) RNA polymerase PAPD5/7